MKTMAYPILPKVTFPDGIMCSVPNCGQKILPGWPYNERNLKVENSYVVVDLVCVYH